MRTEEEMRQGRLGPQTLEEAGGPLPGASEGSVSPQDLRLRSPELGEHMFLWFYAPMLRELLQMPQKLAPWPRVKTGSFW